MGDIQKTDFTGMDLDRTEAITSPSTTEVPKENNQGAQLRSRQASSGSSTASTTNSLVVVSAACSAAQSTQIDKSVRAEPAATINRDDLTAKLSVIAHRRRELRDTRDDLQAQQDQIMTDIRPIVRQVRALKIRLRGLLDDISQTDDRVADLESDVQDNAFDDSVLAKEEKHIRKQLKTLRDVPEGVISTHSRNTQRGNV
ncbi:MAG: hypothetical protein Q9223_002303 [Gallowayella weberi]